MIPLWALRALPYAIVSLVIIGGGFWVGHTLVERGRNEVRPELEKALQELDRVQRGWKAAEEAQYGYYQELRRIRGSVSRAPVRLCGGALQDTNAASGGADGSTTAAGSDAGAARGDIEQGPDIGPELRGLALQCDETNAQLRALQKWISSTTEYRVTLD